MVRCVQRRCFAGAILALVFVLLAAQNTKSQGSANSVECGNHEPSQLLQRGHDMFPKSGYGLPPVVASAGRALTYFELAAERIFMRSGAGSLGKSRDRISELTGTAGALPDGEGSSDEGN